MSLSRKQFLSNLALGSGGLAIMSSFGFMSVSVNGFNSLKAIVIDFDKCAGCRTCETVCSSQNHKFEISGSLVHGLGNPELSNIRVWRYNPPLDIPVTCFLCADAPCVEACPVKPHPETGRKALYRDEKLGTIINDYDRCIGCQSCADACRTNRGGVIFPDVEGSPHGMCTLCDGDPSCVKWCPYEALTYLEINSDMDFRNMTPKQIASRLLEKYYDLETSKNAAL